VNPVGAPVVPVGFEIVVEWENARLSDLARTRRMLAALCSQLRELQLSVAPRAWFLYDPEEIDPVLTREVLAECVDATDGAAFEAILRPAGGLRYYALKNLGAQLCEQPVVVFLDSDVVPEPGWLRRLLEPFARRDVEVVGGSAYVEPDSVYARGFPADPYPDLPLFRGRCVALAATLKARGAGVYRHHGARVSHPAPNGLRRFVLRALAHGHDDVADPRRCLTTRPPPVREIARACRDRLRRSRRQITAGRGSLGVDRAGALAALLLAGAFCTLRSLVNLAAGTP